MNNGLIAFPDRDARGFMSIYTVHKDGSRLTQLTHGAHFGLPSWHPSGRSLACVTAVSPNPPAFVYLMTSLGTHLRQIAEGSTPAWSPDGKTIAYCAQEHGIYRIWLMGADGSNQRPLLPFAPLMQVRPSWSPDGKRLVHSQYTSGAANVALWISDLVGNSHQLTSGSWQNFEEDGTLLGTANDAGAPSWSSTNKIAFWSGIENQFGQIWTIDPDGRNRVQLTKFSMTNDDPAWSPDGKKLLFGSGLGGLWVMNADGTMRRRVASLTANPLPGATGWQPVP